MQPRKMKLTFVQINMKQVLYFVLADDLYLYNYLSDTFKLNTKPWVSYLLTVSMVSGVGGLVKPS